LIESLLMVLKRVISLTPACLFGFQMRPDHKLHQGRAYFFLKPSFQSAYKYVITLYQQQAIQGDLE